MKLSALQQFIRSLAAPLHGANASQKTLGELERLAGCLEPFQDVEVGVFADFLVHADQAVKTGVWPVPGKKPAARPATPRAPKAPKPPKLTVLAAGQLLANVKERLHDPALDYQAIQRELEPIRQLTLAQIKEVATAAGVTLIKKKKDDLVEELTRHVQELKLTIERNQFRGPSDSPPTASEPAS